MEFSSSIQLLKHQYHPVEIASKKDFGIIVAPPGSGKTIVGLKIIEQKQQPAVIITERKEHIQTLYQYLKNRFEIIPISGEDNTVSRKEKWKSIEQENYQAIITTGQFFGEGVDIQSASCMFLVYPFSFKGKLIQYIGRVQRSELTPIIYDYRDKQIPYLNKLFLKRNTYYRNLDRQATLFDDLKETAEDKPRQSDIDKVVKVPINDLDFHYGMVCFSYKVSNQTSLEFEIENEEMLPEFEVLKPYFSKILNSKSISVHVQVGFENGVIVSQIATSESIDRINKEIVDSVKFQFIEQCFIKNQKPKNEDNPEEVSKTVGTFFGSDDNLLETLLKNNSYVHQKQLMFLAKHHQYKKLKIRFVLYPFSFVFLLEGIQKYHIVLETLDTKEVTYVWHVSKEFAKFKKELESINQKLNWIRNNGRQSFLEIKSENFSKIIHDYNEDKKGFHKWKNALEERLV